MKIKAKEIEIINLCLPQLTEFGEIKFDHLSEELGKKGTMVSADVLANIFMKQDFVYKEDCITITGYIVYQYFLTDAGRMLFNSQSYNNFLAIRKEERYKRKIRLSRTAPKDWLDTKFIRMAAFVLFALAVYTFSVGERRMNPRRHSDVERENSQRLSDHPVRAHHR